MGRFVQIRVLATTYDPAAAAAAFPRLYALAWPSDEDGPAEPRGLLALVPALVDRVRLGAPFPEREAMQAGMGPVVAARDGLETALANRDPRTADRFSYDLEDALAALEKHAPRAYVAP